MGLFLFLVAMFVLIYFTFVNLVNTSNRNIAELAPKRPEYDKGRAARILSAVNDAMEDLNELDVLVKISACNTTRKKDAKFDIETFIEDCYQLTELIVKDQEICFESADLLLSHIETFKLDIRKLIKAEG